MNFLTRVLITTRLIYVSSPEYRKEKERKKAANEAAQQEAFDAMKAKPIYFIIGTLCLCVGVVALAKDNISNWLFFLGLIFCFIFQICGLQSYYNAEHEKKLQRLKLSVNAYEFLSKYQKYGLIPNDIETELIRAANTSKEYPGLQLYEELKRSFSKRVVIPKWLIDACEEAERNEFKQES